MEALLDDVVDPQDLKKFEKIYLDQSARGVPSGKSQFDYAWCLTRTKATADLRKGIVLLEDLFHRTTDEHAKRDYLFYLAVGHTKLKEYEKALKYAEAILKVQPQNHQAAQLHEHIKKKMKTDGLVGMAIVGGAAAVVVGSVIGLTAALVRKN